MSNISFHDQQTYSIASENGLSPDGRWAMGLGVIALLLGIGAAAAGAYVGFGISARLVPLPGGLPALEAETMAVLMVACGAVTMLLGAFSIYRAHEI